MRIRTLLALAAASVGVGAYAQTVNVTLSSAQNGQMIAPGANVAWTITFTVSGGDNEGLALLSADLVQSEDNADLFDLSPASGVPAPMANFSRPAGVSNPGEDNPATGYIGVRRGTVGQRNLMQIGGGQNTFGVAKPNGYGVAENANVVGGVGQSGSVTLASGSFNAPSACGDYTFNLANVVANTIIDVRTPPNLSPVSSATVNLVNGTINFNVGLSGDTDNDGDVDITDLSVQLSNFGTVSGATVADGDTDNDGDVDITDLSVLLSNFGRTCG